MLIVIWASLQAMTLWVLSAWMFPSYVSLLCLGIRELLKELSIEWRNFLLNERLWDI